MAQPKFKMPVRTGAIFSLESKKSDCTGCEPKKPPRDPNTHELFGIPLSNPHWPGQSEYRGKFCYGTRQLAPTSQQWHQQQEEKYRENMSMEYLPWPCGPKIEDRHRDSGPDEYRKVIRKTKNEQPFDELYIPTPLPALEKRYKGHYYRIDAPIGQVITPEEITKCRETVFGPVAIHTQDEISDIFVPNYRYMEWVLQPQYEILKQNEMTSPLCRMPEVDSRYYDFYHNVRMDRPSPKRDGPIFGTCAVIPMPRNDAKFAVRQMLL